MSLLSNLFLGGVLLSSLGSVASAPVSAQERAVQNYDFRYFYEFMRNDSYYEKEFVYGKNQFICFSFTDNTGGSYSIDLHKTKSGQPYAVMNGPTDVKNYLETYNGWNVDPNLYPFVAPATVLSNITRFNNLQFQDICEDIFGLDVQMDDQTIYDIFKDDTIHDTSPVVDNVDLYAPVINGYQGVYLSNVNNPITVQTVKSQLKAFDDLDGDLTQQIKIENDTFTGNESKVGEYPVTFSVADKAGNKATITIKIQVIDADLPVFTGPNTFTSNLSNKLTVESIKSQIKVTDNYDKSIQYTIVNDEFTGKEGVPGTYKMKFKAEDSSHNIAYKEVTITVKDDVIPTISGNATYRTSYDQKITLDTIKNSLSVNDNVDKLTSANLVLVEDTYTANYNKSGTYHVKFKVSDTAGNTSNIFDITITVIDEKLPTFEVTDFIINLDHFTTLSREQILELLKNSGQIDMKRVTNPDEQIKLVKDTYNGSQEAGSYKMKLSVTYDDGETKEIDFKINKMENPSINNISLPWYTVFWNWCVKSIFEPIGNFFKSIGKAIVNIFK